MTPKKTPKIPNALLTFISIAITLLALEVIMRITGIGELPYRRPDPLLGTSLIPNAAYRHTQEGYSSGRINSRGLRDHEIAHSKKDGETRILVLGDSFMEAMQVDIDSSFTKLLQRLIGKNFSENHITVINGGRSGMGTAEAYLWYKTEGVKYEPELVLLAFYMGNDFCDNSKALTGEGTFKPFITFDADSFTIDTTFKNSRAFILQSFMQPLFNRSVLATETARRVRMIKTNFANGAEQDNKCSPDLNVFNKSPDNVWDSAYAVTEKLIALLHDEVTSNSSKFSMMLIPDSYQTERSDSECVKGKDLRKPNRFLHKAASSYNIPVFDLTDTFESEHRYSGRHLFGFGENLGDGHWNENGHLLAAETMAANPDFLKLLFADFSIKGDLP